MIKHASQVVVADREPMPAAAADNAADEHIAPAPRVSIQAFCETVETAAAVQAAGEDRRLGKAHLKIQMGGVAAAAEAYRSSPTPNVIVIESENHSDEIPLTTSGPSAFKPRRSVACERRRPTHSKRRHPASIW